MGALERARKAFVKAYVAYDGHTNCEYQYSKNLEKSEAVRQRNIQAVRKAAKELNEECENEIERLQKRIDEIKLMQYHLPEFSYFPKTHYMSLLKETFPEITKGLDDYADRYLNKKYGE